MKHVRFTRIAVHAAVLFAVLPAGPAAGLPGAWTAETVAPASQDSTDLAALIEEALAGHPSLKTGGSRLQAARTLASQAEAPPDPELSVAYLNDGVSSFTLGESEFSFLALTWTQEVPYPGKRSGASDVALLETERLSRDLERERFRIASAVKVAYADLYRLDRTEVVLEETRAVLDSLAETTMRRYEVGQGIQENVLKAQTEILRVEAELLRTRSDRRSAEARLNAAIGRSSDQPVGTAEVLPAGALPPDPEALAEAAVAASPEIASLAAAVRRQEAGVRLAQLDLKPDFLWSATYQNRGGLDPMLGAMFGIRLPVHRERKQSQALLQAEADLETARHQMEELEVRTRASVAEQVSRVDRASQLATLYEQGVIPQARGALESALASYAVGRLGLLDVLNDLNVLLESRIEMVSQEADRFQALASLEPLLALELAPALRALPEGGPDDGSR